MSTKRGQDKKQGPPKHPNSTTWKVDKWNKSDTKTKLLQNLVITNCCARCTDILEWKIKYGKYKPLSAPGKCVKCGEKRVKFAYNVLCAVCVKTDGACAKCGQRGSAGASLRPAVAGSSAEERARDDAEFEREIKRLPERRRRAFKRQLLKRETELGAAESGGGATPRVTLAEVRAHAREELRHWLQKYAKKDGGDDFDADLDEDLDDLHLSDDGDAAEDSDRE